MTALAVPPAARPRAVRLGDLGELVPVSRPGGQGRVYRPALAPASLGPDPVVVKLYRHAPPVGAAEVLSDMVAFARSLSPRQRAALHAVAAWPLAVVFDGPRAAGILMRDVSGRFAVPFVMPSGRRERVLLTLEHLLGADGYLELRGLEVRLTSARRAEVAERISAELAFLHRHGVAASDIAPNNLLIAFGRAPSVCFIDCDSMAFRGRSALPSVQTGDWDVPAAFGESPSTRAADAYKLGLVVLRLFARSHDAREPAAYLRHVPVELRDLLYRSLSEDGPNRPAAGEWQRALRGLLADRTLNQRYPGPAMRITPAEGVAPVVSTAVTPASGTGTYHYRTGTYQSRSAAGAGPGPGLAQPAVALWLRRTVVVLWIVAGAAVLLLVLSRLFASAIPTPDPGGGGSAVTPYYQYGYPDAGRAHSHLGGFIQVP